MLIPPILEDQWMIEKALQYGVDHEVWFEDVRSLNAKFNLVEEFGLRGVGYWQSMLSV